MKFVKSVIDKVIAYFRSGKAEAALNQAAALVPKALPIVQEIAALAPNRTDQEIAALFQKFAVPGAAQYLATPADKRGYVLLQLASEVLAAEVPGIATHVLDTAVQLAVTASRAA
jgi:hypothetical protein